MRVVSAEFVTPPTLAKRYGIKPDKIIRAIRRGELPGTIDVADPESSRPRYLIPPSAIQAFERRRAVVDLPKPIRRRRLATGVKEFV